MCSSDDALCTLKETWKIAHVCSSYADAADNPHPTFATAASVAAFVNRD